MALSLYRGIQGVQYNVTIFDEDISSIVTPAATPTLVIPPGPITRARARQINGQVLSLLCTYDLTNENIILHSCLDLLVLRNKGKIKEGSDQMEQRSCMHVTRSYPPSMSRTHA